MKKEQVARYFFIAITLILVYLSFLILKGIITYIVLALIFAFSFYPVYEFIQKYIKNSKLCSAIMIVLIIIIIIIPFSYVANTLIKETYGVYNSIKEVNFNALNDFLNPILRQDIPLESHIDELVVKTRDSIINSAPTVIGSVAETVLGLFIMFFVMFFAFLEGKTWVVKIEELLPIKPKQKKVLIEKAGNITHAVIYGQVLTSIIQGVLGGLAFLVLGIPGAVLWGFIMTILAVIPMLGTPIIWVPAALIQIFQGKIVTGVILLAFGGIIIMNIDNYLKPKIISHKSKLHPALALIGVLGGLKIFGLIGIVLGPMIFALLTVLIKFYTQEI